MNESTENIVPFNQYDDSHKGGYSYEEKLNLVASNQMDPKEIGLVSSDDAKLVIAKKDPPIRVMKDYVQFEVSEVPLGLRARWAYDELTIKPANQSAFEGKWVDEHLNDHLLQADIRSGNCHLKLQRTVTEATPGMLLLMKEAATLFEQAYAQLKEQAENEPTEKQV